MSLADDLEKTITEVLYTKWNIRDARKVPDTEDVALAGGGVKLDAVFLYADLAQSSELASDFDRRVASKVIKCFLACSTRIITSCDGSVVSFDGDRVMGIFVGDSKNSNSGKCALQINYAVTKLIKPKLTEYFQSVKESGFDITHAVGVDNGEILAIRAGQRGSNDLVWIGRAPNLAAKLSDVRETPYHSFITDDVFQSLNDESKYGGKDKELMWQKRTYAWLDEQIAIHRSNWHWKP